MGKVRQTGKRVRVGRIRRLSRSTAAATLAIAMTTAAASAASMTQEVSTNESVWPVLVPLLVVAASVERSIELGWNYLEWVLLRFLRWKPGDLQTPTYLQFKSGTSLLAGVMLGIVIINYSNMRLLAFLQPMIPSFVGLIPQQWDVILTGLIVGAGSKPAHDILGLVTQLKNFTANSALKQRELAGAALADGIMKLNQAESAYRVDVPGIGPAAVPGGSAQAARSRMVEGGSGRTQETDIDRYAKAIHNNLYIGS